MAAPVALSSGAVFAQDYRIERPLAEGGMGSVYVVEQLSTGKRRALKVMHPTLVPDDKSRARFVDEARVSARIDSDHVVEVLAAGVDGASGIPWLVMELLEGGDLDAYVRARGRLSPAETLELLEQAGHALGRAHALGIIHRDLKPENLFVSQSKRRRGGALLKILDFGIARMVEGNRTAATATSAIGSPLWMAPEQAQPGAKLRASTDVWALGLIAYFMLTGKPYWDAANHPEFNLSALLVEVMTHPIVPPSQRTGEALPPGFDAWFLRCVDRDPLARFGDASQAVSALAAALGAPGDPATAATQGLPFASGSTAPMHTAPLAQAVTPPPRSEPAQSGGRAIGLVAIVALLGFGLLTLAGLVAGAWFVLTPAREPEPTLASEPAELPRRVAEEEARIAELEAEATAAETAAEEAERRAEEAEAIAERAAAEELNPQDDPLRERMRREVAQPATAPSPAPRAERTAADIQRVVSAQRGSTQHCYERAVRQNPQLEGRVNLNLTIAPTGTVRRAECSDQSLGSRDVCECVERQARRWRFPEANDETRVSLPIIFRAHGSSNRGRSGSRPREEPAPPSNPF